MSNTSPYTPPRLNIGTPIPRPFSPRIPCLQPTPTTPQPTTTPEIALGRSIGNFKLVRVLGQGGMGTVYLGKHSMMDKQVAIKTLRPEFLSEPELVARFFREANLLSRVKHPSIVNIYDSGSSPELGSYLIMEYLEGESLQDYLQRERAFTPYEAVQLICQILEPLAAVHCAGILHRDLKPSNIFLVKSEGGFTVKLLDFGISKFLETSTDGLKTTTGYVMGTPAYISPEQAIGRKDISARTDLYAVGTILFEMVTGRRPFLARTPQKMLVMQQVEPPPLPSSFAPGLPPTLEKIILCCLEKDPEDRPQSAAVLLHALRRLLDTLTQESLLSLQNQTKAEEMPLTPLETIPTAPAVVELPPSVDMPANINQAVIEPRALAVVKKEGRSKRSVISVLGLLTAALFTFGLAIVAATN